MSRADERITIIGYGSLLNKTDALRSCPNLQDFRYGAVSGLKRVFNKAFSREDRYQNPDIYPESAVLTVLTDDTYPEELKVSLFSVDQDEYEELLFRERDYQAKLIPVVDSAGMVAEAIIFLGYTTEDEFRAQGSEVARGEWQKVAGVDGGALYRTDILPHKDYLELCLRGAKEAGQDIYEYFLDTTFLGDGITTIRQYLEENPDATRA